jgi:hypothetical protein
MMRSQSYAAQEAADIIIAASKNMSPDTFPALQAAIAHKEAASRVYCPDKIAVPPKS